MIVPTSDAISFRDCCKFILDDWRYRRPGTAPELRDYKQRLLTLLNAEFGIDWRDEDDGDELAVLPRMMLSGYAGLAGPFAGLLEYRFLSGQREAASRHAGTVAAAEVALKGAWVDLFRDPFLLRWPHAERRSTTWTRLRALGLGDAVDETDFL